MTEITRAELEQWRANPVTKMLFDDIAEAINQARNHPRIGLSVDDTVLINAKMQGIIEGYEELDGWYQGKLEEDEVNEDEN